MADLQTVKDNLRENIPQSWNTDEALEHAEALRSAFGDDLRTAFEECTDTTGQSFQECLEDEAGDADLSGTFEGEWEDPPAELINALRRVSNFWDAEARNIVRDVALDANLDSLNRDCARGNYGDVQDELELDSQPGTFRECVQAVSDAQDLRGALKDAWDTNGG